MAVINFNWQSLLHRDAAGEIASADSITIAHADDISLMRTGITLIRHYYLLILPALVPSSHTFVFRSTFTDCPILLVLWEQTQNTIKKADFVQIMVLMHCLLIQHRIKLKDSLPN
jgi:hypothetical protein